MKKPFYFMAGIVAALAMILSYRSSAYRLKGDEKIYQ